jgi:hypothetical protein
MPATIEIVRCHDRPDDLTVYEGIPATTVARALLDAREIVMTERLAEAAREARERGLLRRCEAEQVSVALKVTL